MRPVALIAPAPDASLPRHGTNLQLVAGGELVKIILQHYEKSDSRYKGLLPLKTGLRTRSGADGRAVVAAAFVGTDEVTDDVDTCNDHADHETRGVRDGIENIIGILRHDHHARLRRTRWRFKP
jgi:hypothetical protein